MHKNPKIIIWDLETSLMKVHTWGLANSGYHSIDTIAEDWYIICGAWKEYGSDKVKAVSIKTVGDDYEVVKTLRDVLAEADVIVHHNGDSFDIKKLIARIIYHKLPPLPKILMVDTKKEAKKVAAFTSNKLDYLGKHLLGKGKIHVDFDLWLKVMAGNKKALKEMVEYNKVDVLRLEEVYDRLKPYMKAHPHIGALNGEERNLSCPKCGSTKIKKNGIRITAAGIKKQECQCKDCGAYHQIPYSA